MVVRRLIVAIASLVASISLLAFVLSRVLLGIAGSAEATAGLAEELIDLPPVREAIAEEVVDRLMERGRGELSDGHHECDESSHATPSRQYEGVVRSV